MSWIFVFNFVYAMDLGYSLALDFYFQLCYDFFSFYRMSSSLSSNDSSLSSSDSSSTDDDHITKKKVLMFVVPNVTNYFRNYVVKNPCRDSCMTDHRWVFEILNGHPIHCYQMFRMKKLVFLELCDILETKYNLRKTQNAFMSKLAYFYTC